MEEGRHDDAGVRAPVNPLLLRQPREAMSNQAIVRPASELHHRFQVGRRRDRIEEPDGREMGRDQSMGRDRRLGVDIAHEMMMSASL